MDKKELTSEMNFHNLGEEATHSLYEVIYFNTGTIPNPVGWNQGKRVIELGGNLYKVIEFSTHNEEVWVTLKEYTGKTKPNYRNRHEEEKMNNGYNNFLIDLRDGNPTNIYKW